MVAGMLMPLERLRAILELLFREGVLVAEKDPRPRRTHPQLPGVPNVEVLRAMGSLRSRGLVRETFAWRHFYWYLTDAGIAHLRQYLHLPPDIVPRSMQRVRHPAQPPRRAPHTATNTSAKATANVSNNVSTKVSANATSSSRTDTGTDTGTIQARRGERIYRRKEEAEEHVNPGNAMGGVSQLPSPDDPPAPVSHVRSPVTAPLIYIHPAAAPPPPLPPGRAELSLASRAMEDSGALFPSLVAAGHAASLALVWFLRRRGADPEEGTVAVTGMQLALGTVGMGLLRGFGCIAAPHAPLAQLPVPQQDVASAVWGLFGPVAKAAGTVPAVAGGGSPQSLRNPTGYAPPRQPHSVFPPQQHLVVPVAHAHAQWPTLVPIPVPMPVFMPVLTPFCPLCCVRGRPEGSRLRPGLAAAAGSESPAPARPPSRTRTPGHTMPAWLRRCCCCCCGTGGTGGTELRGAGRFQSWADPGVPVKGVSGVPMKRVPGFGCCRKPRLGVFGVRAGPSAARGGALFWGGSVPFRCRSRCRCRGCEGAMASSPPRPPPSPGLWLSGGSEPERRRLLSARLCCADERDRVQKKTFTKWVNKHLIKHWRAEAQRHVNDLYEDLRDGHNLISLLEVLSGDTLPREKGRMRFHKLQNVQIALNYLKHRQVKLVNIRNDDIADGNPKLTLGLIWTIILHFQISDIQVSGQSEDMTAKEKLLLWSQRMVEDYQGLRCDNFSSSWRDGRLFNAIIHRHKPMLIDMNQVFRQSNLENLDQAFTIAERELGVTRLLDPEDVDVPQPDEKSIITYVSSLYDAMPRVPEVQDGVKANELQLRWQEYYEVVTALLRWQRQHTVQFEERRFPASYEEVEILWRQFLKFKETELPAKEADKNRAKAIFQSLEGAVQSGQLKVPPGYHPLDVEKEWGQLHVAVLEREKLLRAEFERLERLQRVVTKLQMESGLCEEQLNQADALLQADVRLLAAGKAAQRAAELERDLDKADGMIRLLFNDVQTLKDGRHPQGEQMYRRVYRLHERLVAIRTEYNLRLKSGAVPAVTTVTTTAAVPQRPRAELEEATLRYLQDLLAWVEDNQRRLAAAEWGMDLPTVEAQLGSHRGLHQSIEEFRAKIDRARADEAQLSPGSRGAYRECLGKLELQYGKLLTSSKSRLRHLESLQSFVSAATKELLWLSEREEEEVTFDWSHHNPNMAAKKDSYSALMRELELRERRVQELQGTGEKLLREEHPGRQTLESSKNPPEMQDLN
ncbi:plectin [Indicator indicator]|uniref:plectin n=1 Tax=Indicator indicator TaxID=1002788 RepID=UPI0023DECB34|nr:plectin [Indicator indicator]